MPEPQVTILYDGSCALCGAVVDWLRARDTRARFTFRASQEEFLESVVLIDPTGAYRASSAVLRALRRLPGAWPLLWAFILVPRPVRDGLYRWVAKRRYQWCSVARPNSATPPEEAQNSA